MKVVVVVWAVEVVDSLASMVEMTTMMMTLTRRILHPNQYWNLCVVYISHPKERTELSFLCTGLDTRAAREDTPGEDAGQTS